MWKGNDMKYKLKQFRIIENKSTWWTEKGMPGKADCKIISIIRASSGLTTVD